MKDGKRDYRREYDKYHGRPEQIKNRDARNKAHSDLEKKTGRDITGDVDHVKPLSQGGSNSPSNLRVTSKGENRSFKRDSKSKMTSQQSRREKK
jgi:5-methylcytosine-specific restriction endonuclease McrA